MATCPQCRFEVGWRAVFFASALGGIVCPSCRRSLEAEPRRFALLTALTMLVGLAVMHLLRRLGLGLLPGWLGFLAASAAVSFLLSDSLVRLRDKRPIVPTIK